MKKTVKYLKIAFFVFAFGLAFYILYGTSKDDAKIEQWQKEKLVVFKDHIAIWKNATNLVPVDEPYLKLKTIVIYNGNDANEPILDRRNWELPESMIATTPQEVKSVVLVNWKIVEIVNDRRDTVERINCEYQILDVESNNIIYKKEIKGILPSYTIGSRGRVTYTYPGRPAEQFMQEILSMKTR